MQARLMNQCQKSTLQMLYAQLVQFTDLLVQISKQKYGACEVQSHIPLIQV